jgi:hypothetical protein
MKREVTVEGFAESALDALEADLVSCLEEEVAIRVLRADDPPEKSRRVRVTISLEDFDT